MNYSELKDIQATLEKTEFIYEKGRLATIYVDIAGAHHLIFQLNKDFNYRYAQVVVDAESGQIIEARIFADDAEIETC